MRLFCLPGINRGAHNDYNGDVSASDHRKVIWLRKERESQAESLPPFVELLRLNIDALYRVASRLAATPEEAEDIVQSASIRAFRSYGTVRDGRAVRAWLFKILHHTAADHARARARRTPVVDVPVSAVLDALRATQTGFEQQVHDRDALSAAFSQLDPAFREVVWLVDAEGMSLEEVCEILDLPRGTAASRLYRGRQKLRTLLRGGGHDD